MANRETRRGARSGREREHGEMLEAALAGQAFARSWTSIGVAGEGSGAGRVPFGYEAARPRHDNRLFQGRLSRQALTRILRHGHTCTSR